MLSPFFILRIFSTFLLYNKELLYNPVTLSGLYILHCAQYSLNVNMALYEISIHSICCPWRQGLRTKELVASVAVPPAPAKGCVQISWHLSYSRGKPQKTSARRSSDEDAVRPVIASNGIPFLEIRSVGSHSTSGRDKEGKKLF